MLRHGRRTPSRLLRREGRALADRVAGFVRDDADVTYDDAVYPKFRSLRTLRTCWWRQGAYCRLQGLTRWCDIHYKATDCARRLGNYGQDAELYSLPDVKIKI
jgi:hypothetical protein